MSNYRVRFKHGVYPHAEVEATRADIKKYDYFFSGEQKWVGTPRNFDFVDESAQVAADLQQMSLAGPSESNRRPTRRLSRAKTAERVPQRSSDIGKLTTKHSSNPSSFPFIGTSLLSGQPVVATSSPLHARFQHHRHSSPATSSISSLDGSSSVDWHHDAPTSSWNAQIKEPIRDSWPLSDPIEAHLFRVFVDGFARRWDSTNSHDIFATQIPQMALANPMLLDAILMKASQTICHTDPSFPAKPYVYHERLVQQLIPYLANHGQILDEATLVAAILLRGFEEFHAGTRGQFHLSTYELFHGPDGWLFDMSRPIVQACFMSHVHFEIFQAMLGRPSLQTDYREDVLPDLIMPVDDVAWANRIVWISARMLQWAQTDAHLPGEWQHLKDTVDEWERMRPSSFNAFFYREPDMRTGSRFPELWFPNMCHGELHTLFISLV
ncbi:hypothetical protein DE146DRAFT_775469 [Phaeosphaeria sp. MPI-PUGE-AT-0046c]|nr:hypothetical protein DE146DRAFT_775469 [Phaeosphaeria sp. MPI-PUGE-AT-0046c]